MVLNNTDFYVANSKWQNSVYIYIYITSVASEHISNTININTNINSSQDEKSFLQKYEQ